MAPMAQTTRAQKRQRPVKKQASSVVFQTREVSPRMGLMTLISILYRLAFVTALVAVAWEARLIFGPHY